MTMLAGRGGFGGGLRAKHRPAPRHLARQQTAMADRMAVEQQVRAEARQAARALHDAMTAVDAAVAEESWARTNGNGAVDTVPGDGLRSKMAGGVRWSLLATLGKLAGRMGFVVVLMRLLGPANYGIVGQATVYVTVAWIFLNFGMPVTLIQRRRLDRTDIGTAFTLTMMSGVVLGAATALGAPLLALYNLAGRVLIVPIETLGKTADRVILPIFSRLQDDRHRVAHLFLEATATVALFVSLPMALVILCAPLGVPLAFGDAWDGAVLPLQLLAAHSAFFLLVALTNPVVQAAGRADWEFRWSLFTTIIAVVTFVIGLQWGITGVAACFLVQGALLNPIRFVMVQRLIPVATTSYLRQLVPAATSTGVLVGVWLVVAAALRGRVGDVGVLAGASLAASASSLVSMRILWWADLRRQLDFLRQVVRPRS